MSGMELALQLLGTVGLVETVVEFTYVVTNRENFTPFEEIFFLASGCIEMLGEVIFLVAGIWECFRQRDCEGSRALVKDPIHNIASGVLDGNVDNYNVLSLFAIWVSVLSLPIWASFWPAWGRLFDGDGDEVLRFALSTCSLYLVGIMLIQGYRGYDSSADRTSLFKTYATGKSGATVFVAYAMEKTFEVYILLSDLDRLCPGDLGKALVGFQLTEILSVALILACVVKQGLTHTAEP